MWQARGMSELPPLEEPQAYVVVGPDDQRGPYTMELLIGEVLAGRLSDATPVWWPGLADWTTMGGHPGLAAEIHRRRTATGGNAPGWVDPSSTSAAPQPTYEQHPYQQATPYGQESYGQESYGQESYGQGYAEQGYADTGYATPEPAQPGTFGDQANAFGTHEREAPQTFGTGGGEPHGGTLIDVDSTGAVSWVSDAGDAGGPASHDEHDRAFDDLVARSSSRAQRVGRVQAAQDELLRAVNDAVTSQGFRPAGHETPEGRNQLRFEGERGTELVVSLGRFDQVGEDEVRTAEVPFEVSMRSSSQGGGIDRRAGQHGEVVVVADEWSGQSTATVSLVLGLEDYFGAGLTLDRGAVERDVSAAVTAVRRRMG